jgi:hypothetical protein
MYMSLIFFLLLLKDAKMVMELGYMYRYFGWLCKTMSMSTSSFMFIESLLARFLITTMTVVKQCKCFSISLMQLSRHFIRHRCQHSGANNTPILCFLERDLLG